MAQQRKQNGIQARNQNGKDGEIELIQGIRARAARLGSTGLRLGIGDDCALLRLRPGEELAVTTDLSIDGRHFRLDWHTPESIGHRTLARGLSDLAAMGARPVAAFLSLGLPTELTRSRRNQKPWVERFYDGLLALAEAHQTPLAGGDLAQSPLALADIVLVGAVQRGQALLRSGARVGDLIYVTGQLGGSALGLALLAQNPGQALHAAWAQRQEMILAPHLYPQPRIAQGRALAGRKLASAAMDLSDGLSIDLPRLCAESGVAAEIEAEALPIFPGATLAQALDGGEDYELLFTAPPGAKLPRALAGIPLTRIGRIVPVRKGRPTVTLVGQDGSKRPLEPGGWEHFAR
jgi:thiamine-monophosphate kinase